MSDKSYLHWPFFDDAHRQLEADINAWATEHLPALMSREHEDLDGTCIGLVRALGEAARAKIEHFLGCHVYLDLWVKPLKSWRKNRGHLGRFGFRIPDDDDDAHRS